MQHTDEYTNPHTNPHTNPRTVHDAQSATHTDKLVHTKESRKSGQKAKGCRGSASHADASITPMLVQTGFPSLSDLMTF